MPSNNAWSLDIPSLIIGFAIAVYLGYILQQMRKNRVVMNKPDRNMEVYTSLTPRQVFAAASAAFMRYLGLLLLLIISIIVIGMGLWSMAHN